MAYNHTITGGRAYCMMPHRLFDYFFSLHNTFCNTFCYFCLTTATNENKIIIIIIPRFGLLMEDGGLTLHNGRGILQWEGWASL